MPKDNGDAKSTLPATLKFKYDARGNLMPFQLAKISLAKGTAQLMLLPDGVHIVVTDMDSVHKLEQSRIVLPNTPLPRSPQ